MTLTEEEWVRQHMIRYMTRDRKIPAGLISVESGLKYEKLGKRTDIVVFDRNGMPALVVECKSPRIKLNHDVVFQAGIYGRSLKAAYIGITNGMQHFFWRIDHELGKTELMTEFPDIA